MIFYHFQILLTAAPCMFQILNSRMLFVDFKYKDIEFKYKDIEFKYKDIDKHAYILQ